MRVVKGDAELLAAAAAKARPIALAELSVLAVDDRWRGLFVDGGLRRGSLIAAQGVGATSIGLGVIAEASATGSWVAVVGARHLGLAAAAEQGVALERLVAVPDPGKEWPAVVAACVDAVDIVLLRPPAGCRGSDQRRVAARVRERGAVLVVLGEAAGWEVDVRLTVRHHGWHGLADGHGALAERSITVDAVGRRAAARPRRADLRLVS
jgi:hypothetical protein